MKKSFLLFLLLICLAVGGLAGMSVWVSKDNEAVEVAKAYGTEESPRFVNGVLGKLAKA